MHKTSKDQTLKVIDKETFSRCWTLGTKMSSSNWSHSSILTCFIIYVLLNLDLKREACQFTTNKQFSQNSISAFTNTYYRLRTWNSQQQVCRNKSCCELHNFRIFTVYYATVAYNQAVNIADTQIHCTIKNILNYWCQKQTVPHQENCSGAKNKVDSETSPLGNGTIYTKGSKKSMWKNVLMPISNCLLSSIDFKQLTLSR